MKTIQVPVTRFKREIRKFMRLSAEQDVMITKNGIVIGVLLGIERFEQLNSSQDNQ